MHALTVYKDSFTLFCANTTGLCTKLINSLCLHTDQQSNVAIKKSRDLIQQTRHVQNTYHPKF